MPCGKPIPSSEDVGYGITGDSEDHHIKVRKQGSTKALKSKLDNQRIHPKYKTGMNASTQKMT